MKDEIRINGNHAAAPSKVENEESDEDKDGDEAVEAGAAGGTIGRIFRSRQMLIAFSHKKEEEKEAKEEERPR